MKNPLISKYGNDTTKKLLHFGGFLFVYHVTFLQKMHPDVSSLKRTCTVHWFIISQSVYSTLTLQIKMSSICHISRPFDNFTHLLPAIVLLSLPHAQNKLYPCTIKVYRLRNVPNPFLPQPIKPHLPTPTTNAPDVTQKHAQLSKMRRNVTTAAQRMASPPIKHLFYFKHLIQASYVYKVQSTWTKTPPFLPSIQLQILSPKLPSSFSHHSRHPLLYQP